MTEELKRGIYNIDYFSGAQVALYIGDVWIDEITSMSYEVSQRRVPLYGYNDQLFRDVSKGQVLVQGQFSINFKEAGYLFVILNRYKNLTEGKPTRMNPFISGDSVSKANIENMISNKDITVKDRNAIKQALAATYAKGNRNAEGVKGYRRTLSTGFSEITRTPALASLTGHASDPRLGKGSAESLFEEFEDQIWGRKEDRLGEGGGRQDARRADQTELNPFDIYVAFGDYSGNDKVNHTVQKITDVHIIGTSKQIVIDGQPIQEVYSFIARNIV